MLFIVMKTPVVRRSLSDINDLVEKNSSGCS